MPTCTDVLVADRQLAEEIKFDLKRFEEEQRLAGVQRTPAVLTPHAQMVSAHAGTIHGLYSTIADNYALSCMYCDSK